MVQTRTARFMFRTAPGLIMSPAGERETESMYSPYILQELELVIAGADPFAADADFSLAFPAQDGSGDTITVETTIADTTTLADATGQIAAALTADPRASALFTFASDGVDTITIVAKSYNLSIAAADFVATFSDAHTGTVTQTVAASAPSIQMGLFYVYGSIQSPLAISGTPRDAVPAALPGPGTAIADLRGVVGRVVNQTTLSPTFESTSTPDVYPAGQIWPGILRGQVCVRVDPASATMTAGGQVHVVIAAGAYSVIGAVAAAADGVNTIRIDDAPAGNILARAVAGEETLSVFGNTTTGRYIPLKINRTN
ncbi:MAG TPA: hypothetical protein VIK91_28570 [Nannocystis sp.]